MVPRGWKEGIVGAMRGYTGVMGKLTPQVVLIGGPNGAGKTTVAKAVLQDKLGIATFVNADQIATGLSGFSPETVAFAAGRVMLARLKELGEAKEDFAFESTLASRSFTPWLVKLKRDGYKVHIIYVWLRSPELAVQRVRRRVRSGGHSVPDEVIRRRYRRSVANLWNLYMPLATTWGLYDNSGRMPRIIASAHRGAPISIREPSVFRSIQEMAGHG